MGKHEPGTPKYIANKIKSKGLQKLRWYCQMCEKQCRDENGFKCHTMSESHHRQLLLFADNAHKYMDQFSQEFSHGYLHLLKRQFGTRRVAANRVYQDYIADRGHVHMNATIWLSLTAFVKWLGRTGKCVVDETEKGWFVTYIDRDPETLALQEKKAKKEKMDKDDAERMMDFIEKQVEQGRQEDSGPQEDTPTPLQRSEEDGPLVLDLKLKMKPKLMGPPLAPPPKRGESSKASTIKEEPQSEEESDDNDSRAPSECRSEMSVKRFHEADDNFSKKVKRERRDSEREEGGASTSGGWLQEGLVVKIITKTLGQKYYKAKGVVQSPVLESGYVGKIRLTSPEVDGHVVKLDQEHLETVIPAIGREVLIIQGKHKGCKGIIRKVRVEEYSVDVDLLRDERCLKKLPYEFICKFSEVSKL
ncbi:DNA/RNA-binding protein KIN17 [Diachasma alloeum]|uniref:DNA/RNA-binding protein KIN17 n=1 Tax=Diachasma alloeum TaxID=454923 RepID=UPI0007383188|nr:DNA/RNA-binding protein KIN17 [Diachasma alloeum]XP_015115403.1 DNA/RNA-binding protein KIN17 [Diachasma alloeum]XP_015115404.1 DNA/RNA-binding protein KIN17 [Diachasma alloeum]